MERKLEGSYLSVTRSEFISCITNDPADKFAKQFRSKADMSDLWPVSGVYIGNQLAGAIAWTISKKAPHAVNLQLLHTFARHRLNGVGRYLCEWCLTYAFFSGAAYFRVSSEPGAVDFYRKLGIKFWGEQKSGCSLSMFKINGTEFSYGTYDLNDLVIRSAVYSKRRGGCVKVYQGAK